MKLPNSKIEDVAPKNDIRPYLNHVLLERDERGDRLIATDGHILACVPVECDDGDTPGYLTPEAIKAARKFNRREPHIDVNGTQSLPNGTTYTRPTADDIGNYPDWQRIVPDKPAGSVPDLALNADLLAQLQAALTGAAKGTGQVSLYLARNADGTIDPTGAIRVEGQAGTSYGVIMPCRVGDQS